MADHRTDRPPRPTRRIPPTLVGAVAAAILMAPPAAAQDDPCSEADPCPWFFDVDDTGFETIVDPAAFNFTEGDWVVIDVWNFDEAPHTVSFAGMQWNLAALVGARSAPFQVPAAGEYVLVDAPTGDTVPVIVYAAGVDVFEAEEAPGEAPAIETTETAGTQASYETTPGPSGALVLLALLVLARR